MNEKGVRVVSALIPQAVGILVEKEYQEKLSCSDQEATIDYMLAGMSDSVYKVDMFQKLIDHKNLILRLNQTGGDTIIRQLTDGKKDCFHISSHPF